MTESSFAEFAAITEAEWLANIAPNIEPDNNCDICGKKLQWALCTTCDQP